MATLFKFVNEYRHVVCKMAAILLRPKKVRYLGCRMLVIDNYWFIPEASAAPELYPVAMPADIWQSNLFEQF